MAVNAELIRLYWRIGQVIDHRQQQEGYGTAVIPRLARDLHNELPEEKGFSERNIKRMLAFYRPYPHAALDSELVPQPVAQAGVHPASADADGRVAGFPAPLLLAMPWGHHAVLMEKVKDARLRVIYANGTESNLLRRSLQRALYKDETGRRLSDPDMGPLFGGEAEPDDIESGTIYVLRSKSNHPYVVEHRELIHKIGVTGGKVETRIAGANKDATYLLADVYVVATYKLHNLNRTRLENIFHRLFGAVQLDLTIEDRFGNPVNPREWFGAAPCDRRSSAAHPGRLDHRRGIRPRYGPAD